MSTLCRAGSLVPSGTCNRVRNKPGGVNPPPRNLEKKSEGLTLFEFDARMTNHPQPLGWSGHELRRFDGCQVSWGSKPWYAIRVCLGLYIEAWKFAWQCMMKAHPESSWIIPVILLVPRYGYASTPIDLPTWLWIQWGGVSDQQTLTLFQVNWHNSANFAGRQTKWGWLHQFLGKPNVEPRSRLRLLGSIHVRFVRHDHDHELRAIWWAYAQYLVVSHGKEGQYSASSLPPDRNPPSRCQRSWGHSRTVAFVPISPLSLCSSARSSLRTPRSPTALPPNTLPTDFPWIVRLRSSWRCSLVKERHRRQDLQHPAAPHAWRTNTQRAHPFRSPVSCPRRLRAYSLMLCWSTGAHSEYTCVLVVKVAGGSKEYGPHWYAGPPGAHHSAFKISTTDVLAVDARKMGERLPWRLGRWRGRPCGPTWRETVMVTPRDLEQVFSCQGGVPAVIGHEVRILGCGYVVSYYTAQYECTSTIETPRGASTLEVGFGDLKMGEALLPIVLDESSWACTELCVAGSADLQSRLALAILCSGRFEKPDRMLVQTVLVSNHRCSCFGIDFRDRWAHIFKHHSPHQACAWAMSSVTCSMVDSLACRYIQRLYPSHLTFNETVRPVSRLSKHGKSRHSILHWAVSASMSRRFRLLIHVVKAANQVRELFPPSLPVNNHLIATVHPTASLTVLPTPCRLTRSERNSDGSGSSLSAGPMRAKRRFSRKSVTRWKIQRSMTIRETRYGCISCLWSWSVLKLQSGRSRTGSGICRGECQGHCRLGCLCGKWLMHPKRGMHNIKDEMVFRSNPNFVFHDSRGFEVGSIDEFEQMKAFVTERATTTFLKKRIHAIW